MRYLLDTCVISDFVKGEIGTQTRMKQTSPNDIAVSSITVMELRYGLKLNRKRESEITPLLTRFMDAVTVLSFESETAEQAAQIRQFLKTSGQPIGTYDVLIAATSLQHGLIMVTANVREFQRIPNLNIENWRQT
ncbi:type II toxin-antitoxin system VapC family toxin [Baaleninema simplex]|uniref:type II toxin-antitoxin system VapC family toxin n=1 Tax=Baaleninema simplex TaxID=2862350 RepID=UPI0003496596|nr:type II toxin-antitoxin system VapC family toxin [Baaleninema simplex]